MDLIIFIPNWAQLLMSIGFLALTFYYWRLIIRQKKVIKQLEARSKQWGAEIDRLGRFNSMLDREFAIFLDEEKDLSKK